VELSIGACSPHDTNSIKIRPRMEKRMGCIVNRSVRSRHHKNTNDGVRFVNQGVRCADDTNSQEEWSLHHAVPNKNGTPEGVPLICGEYRSRTDDLLHAMQAL
jgi:hypothetical protein